MQANEGVQMVSEGDRVDHGKERHANVREDTLGRLKKHQRLDGVLDGVHGIGAICNGGSGDENIARPHKGVAFGAIHETACAIGDCVVVVPVIILG